MNWTTPTRQPRAQPRAITPKAADDFPLPCPVLRRTTDSARATAGEATRSCPPRPAPAGPSRRAVWAPTRTHYRRGAMAFEDYVQKEIVAECADGDRTRRGESGHI